jgi:hypothetical protein
MYEIYNNFLENETFFINFVLKKKKQMCYYDYKFHDFFRKINKNGVCSIMVYYSKQNIYVSSEDKIIIIDCVKRSCKKAIDDYFHSIIANADEKAVQLLYFKLREHINDCRNFIKSGDLSELSDTEWYIIGTKHMEYCSFLRDAFTEIMLMRNRNIIDGPLKTINPECSDFYRESENSKLLAILYNLGEMLISVRTLKEERIAEKCDYDISCIDFDYLDNDLNDNDKTVDSDDDYNADNCVENSNDEAENPIS